jgi:hypothetical protein
VTDAGLCPQLWPTNSFLPATTHCLYIESGQLADALRQQWPEIRFVYHDDDANRLQWAPSASSAHAVFHGAQEPRDVYLLGKPRGHA